MKRAFLLFYILCIWCFSIGGAQEKADSSAIIATALNYGDGFYSGNAERMESALHPDLSKVVITTLPKDTVKVLQYSTVSQLVELSRAQAGALEEDKRHIIVTILDINGNLASVKLTSAKFNDFLQMVNVEGKWKIVNVLWAFGPDSPNRQNFEHFDPAKEKEPVKNTLNEYYTGAFTGDAETVKNIIHPELRVAQFIKMQQTGKYSVSRTGAGLLEAAIRLKLRVVPEGQRSVDITILDIMDGLAFARAITTTATSYLHLGLIDGNWKIINVLTRPNPELPKQK